MLKEPYTASLPYLPYVNRDFQWLVSFLSLFALVFEKEAFVILEYDAQLILLGAAISLLSSLITTFFNAVLSYWLTKKTDERRERSDRAEELHLTRLASPNDLLQYTNENPHKRHPF